ncbi:acyltransferase family protein [Kocuria nitroreducens]|uniref:acyltransferase family protein n=1 Tax=Kocuria nitroreducens TaxID=3058914 RepID=UPI0036DB0A54
MVALTPHATTLTQAQKSHFRPDIQGLRAVAVLLVVIYHAAPVWVPGGYIGVDAFFVISGFLITTHLLQTLTTTGHISLPRFYAKRALRILPAAFVVVALTMVASVLFMPPMLYQGVFEGAVATALYAPNMLFALKGTNYLAEDNPSVFQHYWSLGIEEQFYLVWPALLLLGWRWFQRSERNLFRGALLLTVLSFLAGLVMMQVSQPWAFFSLPTRAWELGVGALVAFLVRSHGHRLTGVMGGALAWGGLIGLLLVAFLYDSATPFPSFYAAAPVFATAALIIGGRGDYGPSQLLSMRPMLFIGLISYSLYLVHWPMLIVPQSVVGWNNTMSLWQTVVLGMLSLPAAYLLFRYIEDPVRRSHRLASIPPLRSVVNFGMVSVVLAGLSIAGMGVTRMDTLTSGMRATPTSISLFPAGTSYVPANLKPALRDAPDDNAIIYRNGCHRPYQSTDVSGCQYGTNSDAPIVALIGDSHAASWFPALHQFAENGEIRLDSNTKSECHSVTVPRDLNNAPYHACDKWRAGVIQRLNSTPPDLVILANYGNGAYHGTTGDPHREWANGLSTTIKALPESSEVVVIADVPDMGESPAVCLSANLEDASDCVRSREQATDPDLALAEKDATLAAGGTYLDFSDYLCNSADCPSIIGNELVYRDGHHLTATFAESLKSLLWDKLEPLLA